MWFLNILRRPFYWSLFFFKLLFSTKKKQYLKEIWHWISKIFWHFSIKIRDWSKSTNFDAPFLEVINQVYSLFISRLNKNRRDSKFFFRSLDGISDELRDEVWRYLFQFYSFNSTPRLFFFKVILDFMKFENLEIFSSFFYWFRERNMNKCEKLVEYHLMKFRWKQIVEAFNSNEKTNRN